MVIVEGQDKPDGFKIPRNRGHLVGGISQAKVRETLKLRNTLLAVLLENGFNVHISPSGVETTPPMGE
jgi:hypothetical protein